MELVGGKQIKPRRDPLRKESGGKAGRQVTWNLEKFRSGKV